MKVNCPECLAAHCFKDAEVPDGGISVKCSICGAPFRVEKAVSQQVRHGTDESEMTCPRCFITQRKSGTCACCGMVVSQSREAPSTPRLRAKRRSAELHTEAFVTWTLVGKTTGSDDATADTLGRDSAGELFRGLFDLSFDHLITPGMIKVVYGLLLILGGATALIFVNYFLFSARNYRAAAATVMIYVFTVVVVRIQAEFLLVFFMLGKNTGDTDTRTVREDGPAARERIGAR